jgi:hypothetical protein
MSARNRLIVPAVGAAITLLGFRFGPERDPEPLKVGPIAYFEAHCSRCHGGVASPANTAFERVIPVETLRKAVSDMASGPGGQAVTGTDLGALVALHQAMMQGEPFIAWTGTKGRVLTGECSPATRVSAVSGGKSLLVPTSGSGWSLKLPPGIATKSVVLKGERGGKSAVLRLADGAFR